MLSTFDQNLQRRRDVEQFALDSLQRGGLYGDGRVAEAEYHCQGAAGDVILGCRVSVMNNGRLRRDFTLNGRRIAAHNIALRLGELGV